MVVKRMLPWIRLKCEEGAEKGTGHPQGNSFGRGLGGEMPTDASGRDLIILAAKQVGEGPFTTGLEACFSFFFDKNVASRPQQHANGAEC